MPYKNEDKRKEYLQNYYKTNRNRLIEQNKLNQKRLSEKDVFYNMLRGSKNRAKKSGISFNLTKDDLTMPDVCPYLGIPILAGGKMSDNSPSLDRIRPSEGYVKGNVEIISQRANRIKNDGTPQEIMRIASRLAVLCFDNNQPNPPTKPS